MSEPESLRFRSIPDPEIKAGDVIRVVGVEGIESFLVTEVAPSDDEVDEGFQARRVSGIAWP